MVWYQLIRFWSKELLSPSIRLSSIRRMINQAAKYRLMPPLYNCLLPRQCSRLNFFISLFYLFRCSSCQDNWQFGFLLVLFLPFLFSRNLLSWFCWRKVLKEGNLKAFSTTRHVMYELRETKYIACSISLTCVKTI